LQIVPQNRKNAVYIQSGQKEQGMPQGHIFHVNELLEFFLEKR